MNQAVLDYTSLPAILGLARSAYEENFLRNEYGLGLPYYVKRVDQIMFQGDHVLDAGCGAGQWSLALAQRFRQVAALDLKDDRLDVLRRLQHPMGIENVEPRLGSVEALPYEDETFDAVFCYGVIMFTRVEKSLAEFYRVLRPGGRVYVCLNSDGWSRFLIHERGIAEPNVVPIGKTTLYKTFWHRAAKQGLIDSLLAVRAELVSTWVRCLPGINPTAFQRDMARSWLLASEPGRKLYGDVAEACGADFSDRLINDAASVLSGQDILTQFGVERAYQPVEVRDLIERAGFTGFQWAAEAGLICDWTTTPAQAKYAGYFRHELAVWECLFDKPEAYQAPAQIEYVLENARQARKQPVFIESSPRQVLSNGDRNTFPPPLLAQATRMARRHGGPRYVEKLARAVVGNATRDDDVFRRIVRFAQQALYRDPLSQPMTEGGGLPDAATILFCNRGRCGHAARVVAEMCRWIGLESRETQLPKHVVAEVRVDRRWVIADADAFKHGVIPTNRDGQLLSLDDLRSDPYQIDRFPTTGWFMRPGSRYTAGVRGYQVRGYVDALEPEDRGFISGYYIDRAWGSPPSLANDLRISIFGDHFVLDWSAVRLKQGELRDYRVYVGSVSRNWSYDELGDKDEPTRPLPCDVLSVATPERFVEGIIPSSVRRLCASVVAVSDRIELEPETYFRPSEELVHELG